MKLYIAMILFLLNVSYAFSASNLDSFITLAKKTSSIYAGTAQVDVNNQEKISFETLLDNQKVFLTVASEKLNSSVYTLINSEANEFKKKKSKFALPLPPVIQAVDLNFRVDGVNLCSGSGNSPAPSDTSCIGKKCSLTQLIISKCNETNCWNENSTTDRLLSSALSGGFNLTEKINISKCLLNNNEGIKHEFIISEQNSAGGSSVRFQINVQNDVE